MDNLKKIDAQIAARRQCAHSDVRWAADGVDGVCKGCGETVLPRFKSLPTQSD